MLPGDVVLTPNWCWHGHANDSRACAYWLDVLDVPLVQLLEPMFFEPHPDDFEKEIVVPASSPLIFPWAETQRRLAEAEKTANGKPAQIALEPALSTIGLSMIRLKAGQATDPRKIMANNVFGVVEGEGATEVDGETLEWSRGDVIVVPSWREHVHRSETGAVLVESHGRRADFLGGCIGELGWSDRVTVEARRAEEVARDPDRRERAPASLAIERRRVERRAARCRC